MVLLQTHDETMFWGYFGLLCGLIAIVLLVIFVFDFLKWAVQSLQKKYRPGINSRSNIGSFTVEPRFYSDNTNVSGYLAIRDRRNKDNTIWIDCPDDWIPIIVDALNEKVKSDG